MLKKNFGLLLVFGMTACLWSCGDDDDDDTPGVTGGKTGNTGGARTGGEPGLGGTRTGGAPGTGGTRTGGAPGTGGVAPGTGGTTPQGGGGAGGMGGDMGGTGASGGDMAGMGGVGGTGATGATGGDMAGMGGEAGGGSVGGASGGAGGADGTGPMTIEEACEKMCADQADLPCSRGADCAQYCSEIIADTAEVGEALVRCQAEKLTAASYVCDDQTVPPAVPGAMNGSACQTEICAHQCDVNNFSGLDEVIYEYCGCL